MSATPDLLFVYGSLLSTSSHPMAAWLAAHADLLGAAVFKGKRFQVDWYPGVVPGDDGDAVVGEVHRLHDPRAAWPLLDAYEETGPGAGEHAEFRRALVEVTMADGRAAACWIYLYNRAL